MGYEITYNAATFQSPSGADLIQTGADDEIALDGQYHAFNPLPELTCFKRGRHCRTPRCLASTSFNPLPELTCFKPC